MGVLRNQLRLGEADPDAYGRKGRLLTYETVDELVAATKEALYIETACAKVGVTQLTVEEWIKHGKDMLERLETGQVYERDLTFHMAACVDLFIDLNKVLAEAEIEDISMLNKLVTLGDFRAIKFKLERRSPTRWGKKDHLSIDDGKGQRVAQEQRVVDYKAEIEAAEEFKMLEEEFEHHEDILEVEVLGESSSAE